MVAGSWRRAMGCAAVVIAANLAWADTPAEVPVEISQPLPRPRGGLGTMEYRPTEKEKPYLAKVNEQQIDLWGAGDATANGNGGAAATAPATQPKPYTLAGQVGKYVGWFGIVRENTWDDARHQSTLLLEHKYFDGLTDTHMQVVSIYGAGDFRAVFPQKLDQIPRLSLVRIYGTVALDKDGTPLVTPEYVREWSWTRFTFMDYGEDHSNPQWVKLRKVTGMDVYDAFPDAQFYEDRLGKP